MNEFLRRLEPEEVAELEETGDLWVWCPSYPDYTASWSGQVKSWSDDRFPDGRLLLPYHRTNALGADGRRRSKAISQFIADAFLVPKPEPASLYSLRHIDGNQWNDCALNLAWEDRQSMALRTVANGNHPMAKKTHCVRNHPLSGDNLRITRAGSRSCVTCSRAAWSASRARRRAQDAGKPSDHITTDWVLAQRLPKEDAA